MKIAVGLSITFALLTHTACTKKPLATDLDLSQAMPSETISSESKNIEPPKEEEKKAKVKPPELMRIDEDTIAVQGEEIGLVRGTEVSRTNILGTKEPTLVAKDDVLFIVKAPKVPEVPEVDVKTSPEKIEIKVESDKEAAIIIIAAPSEDSSEELCLALRGSEAGKLVVKGTPECWSSSEDIAPVLKPIVSEDEVKIEIKPELIEELPLIIVGSKPLEDITELPPLEEAPISENDETLVKDEEKEESKGEGTLKSPEVIVVKPEGETSDDQNLVESLPIVIEESLDGDVESMLLSPNLPSDEKDRIAQLRDAAKKAKARYKEKKERLAEIKKERNKLRKERKDERERLSKGKSAELRQCKKKEKEEQKKDKGKGKDKKTEKCDSLASDIEDLKKKEKDKTREIAELKDALSSLKNEALEDLKEYKARHSEIKAIGKR